MSGKVGGKSRFFFQVGLKKDCEANKFTMAKDVMLNTCSSHQNMLQ